MGDYPFLKGHGTENDFVLLPDHDGTIHGALSDEEMAARVRRLCDRRAGIGGDGVLPSVPRLVKDVQSVPETLEELEAYYGPDYLKRLYGQPNP